MAPEPVYNNLRAIIDKLDVRRAQVFVEALIVEVTADKAAEFGIQWQALDRQQLDADAQGIGGTNFGAARQRQQHHRRRRSTSAALGQGLNLGVIKRHDHDSRASARSPISRLLARALETQVERQHPVDADAADARQRGSADHRRPERAVHHRPVRARPARTTTVHAVPDDRAQGRRPHAARQAADHRGRHRPPRRSTRKCRASTDIDQRRRHHHQRSARSNRR